MYAWEAAQFVFYDFRLLCALMRGACPSALLFFARLRQRLPLLFLSSHARRRSSVTHSVSLELQTVPRRGAEHRSRISTSVSEFDIGVGDVLDHAADREDRPSPQPLPSPAPRLYPKEECEWSRLTFFRFCNILAKLDYLVLRFTTFASLLALLVLLDLPSQTVSASAALGSRFSETLTCEEWKVINIVAWVSDRNVLSSGPPASPRSFYRLDQLMSDNCTNRSQLLPDFHSETSYLSSEREHIHIFYLPKDSPAH